MPVIAPALNATVRPRCRLVRAASAVRTLARTEMFMPMKPAAPDSSEPRTKPPAEIGVPIRSRNTQTRIATTMPTTPIVLYWRSR